MDEDVGEAAKPNISQAFIFLFKTNSIPISCTQQKAKSIQKLITLPPTARILSRQQVGVQTQEHLTAQPRQPQAARAPSAGCKPHVIFTRPDSQSGQTDGYTRRTIEIDRV
mmetsp:Transcript_26259/g.30364  ORF Transcript_26259/g.30364 Transcript_26259/m.30364 type:complete len:111 (-) Transcript_26259:273-605(-)